MQQQGQETSSSTWQGLSKTDSTSDAGDDTSSIKSGSTVTNSGNVTSQTPDSSTISTSAVSSSSPWNANPSLSGMDTGPWANSSSPAPSLGWNSNPSNNQSQNNNMQQGPSAIGSNLNFSSTSSASGGWPSGSMASGMPPNVNNTMTSGNISSQWPASSMLGKIDFQKAEGTWNNPSSLLENKDLAGSDPRWGLVDKGGDQNWEPPKSQWGNNPIGGSGDQGASNGADGLSFAQATLKGLKIPPSASGSNQELRNRADDILRAIENHEGWGSRPIRQDTSWEAETSPKSQRKFQTDNSGASNVWNNSNGTAIWEAVRENQGQGSNWNGGNGNSSSNSWNADKEPQGWQGGPKPQDPSQWGVPGGNMNESKSFGTWESGGAGDASNKMYGQKSSIGSWGGDVQNVQQRPTNISSWQDEGDNNTWEQDPRRSITGAMSTMQSMVPPSPGPVTGMAGMMPQGMAGMGADPTPWNGSNSASMNRTKMDEPWNTSKPPPSKMPGSNGWGIVESEQKVDDGTGIWAANIPKMPKQAGAGGWGNEMPPQGQWNPKQMPPGGWDEHSYMIAQRNKQMLPNKFNSNPSNQPPPQMRAKALQQLMDMGFRKEEAQQALIGHNMDIGSAISELKSSSNMQRKDLDMEMYSGNNPQNSRMPYMPKSIGNDLNDTQSEQVPNFSTNLPNTPFPNAQLSSQPFIQGNSNMPPSSLNPNNSMNNQQLQQKLMQKIQQGPPNVMGPRGQMPPVGGANNNQALQQQQQQQQILSQLRQAVSNGYISPQLLNNPLPHNILVLLQQLLQLQQAKQGLVTKLQQNKNSPIRNQQVLHQLEQLPVLINNINQQINSLQKQLQQAQNNFFSTQDGKMPPRIPPNISQQPPSGMVTPVPGHQQSMDNMDALSSELASVSMNPPQSRLTNIWKTESSSADGSSTPITSAAISDADDKTKGILNASSSPSLTLFENRTWSSMSTTTTSNWPMSSTDSAGTNSQADPKSSIPSSTSTSSATGMSSSGLADMVPEFVPGKPWQGFTKNVEDDPHMTPGSMISRSLSVNKVHDDSLSNLSDGHKMGNMGNNLKNENNMFGHLGHRPPPNMAPGKMAPGSQQWQNNYQRQNTWGGRSNTSAFTQVGNQNWNDQSHNSSWILLKHPNSSLDSTTLKALCGQHGNLTNYFPQGQAALVQFSTRDQAYNAVQRLNNFQVGNTVIGAEMIGESEAQRAVSQNPPPQPNNTLPPINPSQWSHAPPTFPRNSDPWGSQQMPGHPLTSRYGSGDPWGGSGLWGDMNSMADHNSSQMLSNILGSETM